MLIRPLSLLLLAVLVARPRSVDANSGAEDVVALRLEVESLARGLDERRDAAQAELAGLRAERAELQKHLRLAKMRYQSLQALSRHHASADAERQAAIDEWHAPARASALALRGYVEQSLPFARAERLAAVDRIIADLAGAAPDTAARMAQLWRLIEEESAMTRDVARAQQRVDLGDGEQMVDVLRIGMSILYVRTLAGQVGWARRRGESWQFELVDGEVARGVILELFDAADESRLFAPVELLIPFEDKSE